MDMLAAAETLEFEGFRIDLRERKIFRMEGDGNAVPVELKPRAFDLLSLLVSQSGVVVTKSKIMDVVWPGLAVEENNITVQIANLRHILDQDRAFGSCIQTVHGRGYRFLPEPRRLTSDVGPMLLRTAPLCDDNTRLETVARVPPRLSIAVVPFSTLDGAPELKVLADGIADDLTTALVQLSDAPIIVRQTALRSKDQPINAQKVGWDLNVRYVLTGSLRIVGNGLRANVVLTCSETADALWVDQLDVGTPDDAAHQEEIAGWLRNSVRRQLICVEAARSVRERPDHPDALDLVLQGHAVMRERPSADRRRKAQAIYERALQLEPVSLPAMAGLAELIINHFTALGADLTAPELHRADDLITAAEALAPTNAWVIGLCAYLLRLQQRWPQAEAAYERALSLYPHYDSYLRMLGICKLQLGRPEEAVPFLRSAIRNNPRDPDICASYSRLGQAMLLLGKYDEAVHWVQRSLAANPEKPAAKRSFDYLLMASAYGLAGQVDRAEEQVAEAVSRWPYLTVQSFMAEMVVNEPLMALIDRARDGLRLAGLREHVNEDEDFGVLPDSDLRTAFCGKTPMTVPGGTTLRTEGLCGLLRECDPILIDASQGNRTLAGAVCLHEAGLGGTLDDSVQDRLRPLILKLAASDPLRPIVTLGVNAERWSGYNLVLRLASLGHGRIYWYRGGREAWSAAGLRFVLSPMTALGPD
jgi:TolB-like protein/DNA-binding winged helix-turn-helix (wHTH) protein/tetratricopeptide (TPR) repeat protein